MLEYYFRSNQLLKTIGENMSRNIYEDYVIEMIDRKRRTQR